MSDNEKQDERAAFEAWIESEAGPAAINRWLATDAYANLRVQDNRIGWVAALDWQARAALAATSDVPSGKASEMPAAPQVPPGYVLVPVEPTPEMVEAGRWSEYLGLREADDDEVVKAWTSMLAAAP